MWPLSPYAETCLKLFLARFPQFEPYVEPFEIILGYTKQEYVGWRAVLPWPNGWDAVGLGARTIIPYREEEFEVTIGNCDAGFGDYDDSGTFEHLEQAFQLIDDILNERQVLFAIWLKPTWFISRIEESNYIPTKSDWMSGVSKIWRRSWLGTYNQEWIKS